MPTKRGKGLKKGTANPKLDYSVRSKNRVSIRQQAAYNNNNGPVESRLDRSEWLNVDSTAAEEEKWRSSFDFDCAYDLEHQSLRVERHGSARKAWINLSLDDSLISAAHSPMNLSSHERVRRTQHSAMDVSNIVGIGIGSPSKVRAPGRPEPMLKGEAVHDTAVKSPSKSLSTFSRTPRESTWLEWKDDDMYAYREKQYTQPRSGYQRRGKLIDKRTLSKDYLKGKSLHNSSSHELSIHMEALKSRIAAIDMKMGRVPPPPPQRRRRRKNNAQQSTFQSSQFSSRLFPSSEVFSPIIQQDSVQQDSAVHSPPPLPLHHDQQQKQQQRQQRWPQDDRNNGNNNGGWIVSGGTATANGAGAGAGAGACSGVDAGANAGAGDVAGDVAGALHMVRVQVPEGALPGQELEVVTDTECVLYVQVPENLSVGDFFDVQYGIPDEQQQQEEEDKAREDVPTHHQQQRGGAGRLDPAPDTDTADHSDVSEEGAPPAPANGAGPPQQQQQQQRQRQGEPAAEGPRDEPRYDTVLVTVPEGVVAGQELEIMLDTGHTLRVAVPAGVPPGQDFNVEYAIG